MQPFNKSRTLKIAVDLLVENRLVPKSLLKYRGGARKRFIDSYAPKNSIGAEIGVQKGFFTHAIIDAARPARLHLIDPWYLLGESWEWADASKSTTKALENVIHWFKTELARGEIVLHIGFDADVLASMPDDYFDWVYLDTTHMYEDTKQELELLNAKVKDKGIILGDDWFSNEKHPFYGQYRAINDFLAGGNFKLLAASDDDHQWAIAKE